MFEFVNFLKDEDGQGMVEYALIIAFIALAVITGLTLLGNITNDFFNNQTLHNALS